MRKPRTDPILDVCVVEMAFNGTENMKIPTVINVCYIFRIFYNMFIF